MSTHSQRKDIIESLIGNWHTFESQLVMSFTLSELDLNKDSFKIICNQINTLTNESVQINLNFLWTNTVLRVNYMDDLCIVCFISNNSIGLYKSILTCNEARKEDLIVEFSKDSE